VIIFSKDDYKGALAAFDSVLMISPDNSPVLFNKALIYVKQANSDDFEKTIDLYIEKMKAANDEAKVKQASIMALEFFRASGSKADQAANSVKLLTYSLKLQNMVTIRICSIILPRFITNRRILIRGLDYARKDWPLEPGDVDAQSKILFSDCP